MADDRPTDEQRPPAEHSEPAENPTPPVHLPPKDHELVQEALRVLNTMRWVSVSDAVVLRTAVTRLQELAVQCPPLGYVVLKKRSAGRDPDGIRMRTVGPVWGERQMADTQLAERHEVAQAHPEWFPDATFFVAEVREAQP